MIVEVPSPSKFYVTRSLTWDGSVTSATITGESGKPGIVVVEVLSGSPITRHGLVRLPQLLLSHVAVSQVEQVQVKRQEIIGGHKAG